MVLSIIYQSYYYFSCTIQTLLRTTTELLTYRTAMRETVSTMFLNHFIHTLHAKHLGTSCAKYIFPSNVSTTMTRGMMCLLCLSFQSLIDHAMKTQIHHLQSDLQLHYSVCNYLSERTRSIHINNQLYNAYISWNIII